MENRVFLGLSRGKIPSKYSAKNLARRANKNTLHDTRFKKNWYLISGADIFQRPDISCQNARAKMTDSNLKNHANEDFLSNLKIQTQ